MPSPLGTAIGGIAEFLKLQRGLTQDTENREREKAEFESAQELRRVQTEGAGLQNKLFKHNIDRLPAEDAQKTLDNFVKNFGTNYITEDHIQAFIKSNPELASQADSIRQSVAAAKTRQEAADKLTGTQQQAAQLQVDTATAQLPGIQKKAAQDKEAWDWLAAHPNADPRTDFMAYQMNKRVGNEVELTPMQKQEFALRLAAAQNTDYGAAETARLEAQERHAAKSLPPGVSVQAVNVFEPLLQTFAQNAKTGMDRIQSRRNDLNAPERQTYFKGTPGAESYAQQELEKDAQLISNALYKEADDIIVQLRKAGHTSPEVEQFARARLRQILTNVPKYYNGQIVGRPTGPVGPGGSGPQLSGGGG